MAEKRMFSAKIIESDAFLDIPATAQMLYFHVCMNADDDGFVNNPTSVNNQGKTSLSIHHQRLLHNN